MSTTAYGWELTASSASGGKVYQIIVADNIVVTGWGSTSVSTRQYKIESHRDAGWANRWAIDRTAEKEARGYVLTTEPRFHEIDSSTLADLRRMVGHRGANSQLQQAFNLLVARGSKAP